MQNWESCFSKVARYRYLKSNVSVNENITKDVLSKANMGV